MNRDQLFLLRHNFPDQGKIYYCPGCTELIGLFELYPLLKRNIDIHYLDFPRPRPELVSLLGERHQGCPVLVLAELPVDPPVQLQVRQSNGRAFVTDAREIGTYLAHVHGIGMPH